MTVQITRRPFTVTDYRRMLEAGILSEDDRVELIDGEVRAMSPIEPFHAAIVKRFNALLNQLIADTNIISIQDPIQLSDYTEPEPDIAILRLQEDFYATQHPTPPDVLLIIEVADSSVEYDREEKIPRYAQAGIPEVWLVDVANETVEQYTQPRIDQYGAKQTFERGQVIRVQSVPQIEILVNRMFG